MTRFLKNALLSVSLAFISIGALAGDVKAVNAPPKINAFACWSGDKMFRAAERDGYRVGAEATSEAPGSAGAQIYFFFDQQGGWGFIDSFLDPETKQPRQCNLGGSEAWEYIPPKTLPAILDPQPLNKSLRICRPLPHLLSSMAAVFLEVPLGRSPNGRVPDSDLMLTASANGHWSVLTIDKRSQVEVACLSNWGTGFLVKNQVVMQAMR